MRQKTQSHLMMPPKPSPRLVVIHSYLALAFFQRSARAQCGEARHGVLEVLFVGDRPAGRETNAAMALPTAVDVDLQRMRRASTMSAQTDVDETDEHIVCAPFDYPPLAPGGTDGLHRVPADWEVRSDATQLKHEELTRAVSLGLYGYARRSRSSGFVISMSGGADSAACAVLCRTMVELARITRVPLPSRRGHGASPTPARPIPRRFG